MCAVVEYTYESAYSYGPDRRRARTPHSIVWH